MHRSPSCSIKRSVVGFSYRAAHQQQQCQSGSCPPRRRETIVFPVYFRKAIGGGPNHAERVPPMRIALLIAAAMVAAIPSLAHSWYPPACCGDIDCCPVACDQLVETGSGWLYVPTGNLFKHEQV